MNKEDEVKNLEVELDLSKIYELLKKNLKLILLSVILFGIIAFLITTFFITKKYASEARVYLMPKINDQGYADNNAVSSNSKMVNNYVSLMQGETILSKVAEQLDIDSVEEIKNSLSISNELNTEIISVKAVTDDPVKSQAIAKATVEVFFQDMQEKLDIKNMTISDEPKVDLIAVSPNKKIYTAIGALLGLCISSGYVFFQYLFDKRLKSKSEAESFLGFPVLGEIPWFED